MESELGGPLEQSGKTLGEKTSSGMFGSLAKGAAVAGVAAGAALGAGIIGAGVGLFKLGATFDDAFDQIRTTTGATGETLAGLEGSFKTVFASVPTDAGTAAAAVATLSQKLGLTGQPLEDLSVQLINLSRITGTDLAANMAGTVDVFNSFGVAAADQPAKLDELFRASQATGVGVDVLAATMAEAGPNLQQLGLSFEESAGLVAIFGKAGVDVGAVMPALSKTIVSAAKDGKNAGDVFKDTFAAIKGAPDDTSAAAAAIEVFGAKAGPKLAGLIREGKVGYEELAASIAAGGDTINGASSDTADFAEKWGTFKNQVLVGLEPLATGVFSAIGTAMEKIGPAVGPVIKEITGGFSAFFLAFKEGNGDVTSSGFPGFMEKLANLARALWDAISKIDFKAIFDGVVEFITPIAAGIGDLVTQGVALVQSVDWGAVFTELGKIALPILEAVKDTASKAFEFLKTAADTLFKLIRDNRETIATVADVIKNVLATGADAAAKAIDALGKVFDFLSTHMGLVKAIVIPLAAAFAAYRIVMLGIQAVTFLVTTATAIWTGVQAAFNVVMALNPIGLVVAAIVALVAGVIYAYTHFEGFRNVVDTVWQVLMAVWHWIADNWPLLLAILLGPFGVAILVVIKNFDTIKAAVETAFNWVRDNWPLLLAIITGPIGLAVLAIVKNWDTIKDAFTAVKDWIQNRIEDIVGFFVGLPGRVLGVVQSVWDGIKNGITSAAVWVGDKVNEIVGFLTGIPSRIAGAFGGAFDGLAGAFKSAVNAIIRAWNSIPSITLPSVSFAGVTIGGQTIGFPKLGYLAAGGIVTKPTLAMIGEAGPEAIIPLRGPQAGMYDPAGASSGRGDINVYAQTDADPWRIADEIRWARKTAGV